MIAPEPVLEPRGTPISVYQRLKALSSLGHQLDLVTYHLGEDIDIPGVEIHRIPKFPFIKKVKIGPSMAKLFMDVFVFLKALAMLMTHRYEVIHSHEEAAFFGIFLARLFGTLHIYDMHSSLPNQLRSFEFWGERFFVIPFKALERMVLRHSDAVIAIDAELFDRVQQISPAVAKIRIDNVALWNGFHKDHEEQLASLRQSLALDGKRAIVYTGSFEKYQGLELLLESAGIVRQSCPEIAMVLVGGHPYQIDRLQKEAQSQNLGDHVRFVGIVPPDQVVHYLKLAVLLASPRLYGTSVPLKIYSYLQSGKPIIATDLPAHTQILNRDTALLVEPDKHALAAGILTLLRDPDLRDSLGHNAKHYLEERYSWDIYLGKVQKIYDELNHIRGFKAVTSEN